MADKQGKRVAAKTEAPSTERKKSSGGKAFLVLALLVVGGYLALCGWVAASEMVVVGEVKLEDFGWSVKNLTSDELFAELDAKIVDLGVLSTTFQYGGSTVHFDRSVIDIDREQLWLRITALHHHTIFPFYGAEFLSPGGATVAAGDPGLIEIVDQTAFDKKIAELHALVSQSEGRTTFEVRDDALHFVKGTSYQALDEEQVKELLLSTDIFLNQSQPLEIPIMVKSADEFDMAAVAKQIYVEPESAVFDPETRSILPHVTGLSLDGARAQEAQAIYDRTPEGASDFVKLILTEPEMTTEGLKEILFRDVLGQSDTYVGGIANRVSNVRVMANAVNEMVLLPGESFSYLAIMNAQRSQLLNAPVYVRGETVDDLGGGICQVSSMIYYAVFHADLKVIQRAQHAYVVGYIRDGLDATVFNPAPDFKFENDTEYPIKIVSVMSGRNLSISILGTKTNDWVVSFERAYSDQNPFETIYEFSEAVPIGTVEEAVDGYTGVKVIVWKVIHDGEGNLISRELESTNNYRRRDRILIINPADAVLHGLEPPPGFVLPTPVPIEPPVPVNPETPPQVDSSAQSEAAPESAVPEGIPAA